MKTFEKRDFIHVQDYGANEVFSDLEFRRCYFESCMFSMTINPNRRSTARNINVIRCEQRASSIEAGIIENVCVDGLETHGLLQTWGTLFRHVTLRGKIGRIMFNPLISPLLPRPPEQTLFDQHRMAYYASIDWALDLREGQFYECDIRGIPARVIRRDPQTQVIVRREKARERMWEQLDLSRTHWRVSLGRLAESDDEDKVLVAPKRSPKYGELLKGLMLLREAGVAEPN